MRKDASRLTRSLRLATTVVLLLSFVVLVVLTYRWPLQKDAQVMHYINFLIDKGFRPYVDITDSNMPGAYLTERWGVAIFGRSDLAWRIYDFSLLGIFTAAAMVIATPYDWLAGLLAGAWFALLHTIDGAGNTGERDEVMAVLIVVAYACLFQALRRGKPWLMAVFAFMLGIAASIKPTVAPLGFALLALAWWSLRSQNRRSLAYLLNALAGALLSIAIMVGYLLEHQSFRAFFAISARITTYYAGMNHLPAVPLLLFTLPNLVTAALLFALAVCAGNKEWKGYERPALLLGVAMGVASFYLQGKGYTHHRYPLLGCIVLWIAIELFLATRREASAQRIGWAGILLVTFLFIPRQLRMVWKIHPVNQYTESIEHDLTALGGDRLQQKVQCMDLVYGCLTALYHLQLVQSTGSTGDILLFTPDHSAVPEFYRAAFTKEIQRNPPTVYIFSTERWQSYLNDYDKLKAWPQFAAYLDDQYDLVATRSFPLEEDHGYRVYVRKGARLPALSATTIADR